MLLSLNINTVVFASYFSYEDILACFLVYSDKVNFTSTI